MPKSQKLTPRQERFAREYVVDLNATQAALRAGYAERGASQTAAQLLANPKIQAAVAAFRQIVEYRTDITIERTLTELARVGFADLRQAFDANGRLKRPEEWSDDLAAAISSVEVAIRDLGEGEVEHVHKLKLWDKNSALEKIAKHLGMLVDRKHITGDVNVHAMADAELVLTIQQITARLGMDIPAALLEAVKADDEENGSQG